MKLTEFDKRSITVVGIIVALAVLFNFRSIIYRFKKPVNKNPLAINYSYTSKKTLPAKVKQISKKHHFLEDAYNSDKILLFFSYDPISIDEEKNRKLYKKFTALLEKQPQLKSSIKIYKKGEKIIEKFKSNYAPKGESCSIDTTGDKDLDELIEITETCFKESCIIVPEENSYYVVSKKAEYMLNELSKMVNK